MNLSLQRIPQAFALSAILCIPLLGCLSGADMCGNDIKQTATSPNGKLKAVVFSRDCGATTGYTTTVSVLDASEPLPNNIGNIFWLEEDDIHEVRLEWKSDKKLILHNRSTKYWIDEHPRISTRSGDVWIDVAHQSYSLTKK